MEVGFFFFKMIGCFSPRAYFGEFYWQPNHLQHPEILTRHGVIQVTYHPARQFNKLSVSPSFWAHIPACSTPRGWRDTRRWWLQVFPLPVGTLWLWSAGPGGSPSVSSRILANKSQAVMVNLPWTSPWFSFIIWQMWMIKALISYLITKN